MYTTPSTTAGEEENTRSPSHACHAGVRNGAFLGVIVVSSGLTPVCASSNRNCGQSTSADGAPIVSASPLPSADPPASDAAATGTAGTDMAAAATISAATTDGTILRAT